MAGRIRTPKNFVLEERLERYEHMLEVHPERYAGRWAEACWPAGTPGRFREVRLDLGCGKGAYIIEAARREPDVLFIGMDVEPVCVAYAAQYADESGLGNLVVIPGGADRLVACFAAGELSAITLNFSTPHPKARYAHERLTHVDKLLGYRELLAPGGTVTLRTDSEPLWLWSLVQFEAAGYRMLWTSRDTRSEHPELPATEYERRLADLGAATYGICAEPGPVPTEADVERGRSFEASLAAFLPHDLFSLEYVPYGMEDTVVNLRNRTLRERRAAYREHAAQKPCTPHSTDSGRRAGYIVSQEGGRIADER